MRVGIPTEIKNNEYRVAITPAGVAELVRRGHEVLIQAGAGHASSTRTSGKSRPTAIRVRRNTAASVYSMYGRGSSTGARMNAR